MRTVLTTAIVASALLVHQALASSWSDATSFSSPYNTNNNCSADQQSGFDWQGLATGSFSSFGGFSFSGFQCTDSFQPNSKRSLFRRGDFQSKCIQGKVTKDSSSSPQISCGHSEEFSITTMQVSVSFDTDLDFIFGMPDGSTCTHTASCSASGTTIENQQCGGAKSVTFQIPQHGSDQGCDVGIHSVAFDCQPASSTGSTGWTGSTTSSTTVTTSTTAKVVTTTTTSEKVTTTTSSHTTTESWTTSTHTSPVTPTTTVPVTTSSLTTTYTTTKPWTTSTYTSPATTTTTTTAAVTTTTASGTPTTAPGTTTTTTTNAPATTTTTAPATTTTTALATTTPSTQTWAVTTSTSTTLLLSFSSTTSIAVTTIVAVTSSTTSPVSTTTVWSGTTTSISSSSPAAPATSTSTTTTGPAEIITTEIVISTVTTCPVTLTSTSGSSTITSVSSTISTVIITSTSTVCTKCTAPPPSTLTSATQPPSSVSVVSSSSPPPESVPCPSVLPSCLNTWLSLVPQCKSNSDISCFCPSSNFTSAVISCVSAWSTSDSETQAALSYLAGICAEFIPQNPGICTAIPSTITLIPTPAPASSPPTVTEGTSLTVITTASGKVKTITVAPVPPPATIISFTHTVAITTAATPIVTVITTAVTVPQVTFITNFPPAPTTTVNGGAPGISPPATALPVSSASVGLVPIGAVTTAEGGAPGSSFAAPTGSHSSWGTGSSIPSATITQPSVFTGAANAQYGVEYTYGAVAGALGLVALFI